MSHPKQCGEGFFVCRRVCCDNSTELCLSGSCIRDIFGISGGAGDSIDSDDLVLGVEIAFVALVIICLLIVIPVMMKRHGHSCKRQPKERVSQLTRRIKENLTFDLEDYITIIDEEEVLDSDKGSIKLEERQSLLP